MALKSHKEVLELGPNKSGVLSQVRSLLRQENVTYLKQLVMHNYQSMQLLQEKNELILKKENNILSNLKRLQEKLESIVKLNDNT